jgi:hypothetical protein
MANRFDSALRDAVAAGRRVVWSGAQEGQPRYAYVESSAGPAAVFEIMAPTDLVSASNQFMRDAANGWDGTDPIRTVG